MECLEKLLIFIVAFVLWSSGIILIVFGSIALADPDLIIELLNLISGVVYVTSIFDVMPLFEGVAIFMIVLGCFLFLAGGVGCGVLAHGKVRFGYILFMSCAILTEIALIIYAAVYPNTVIDWVETEMKDSLTKFNSVDINDAGEIDYAENEQATAIAYGWQHLQFESQCCGPTSPDDFASHTWRRAYRIGTTDYTVTYPPSCCSVKSEYYGKSPENVNELIDYRGCFNSKSINSAVMSVKPCSEVVMSMVWQFNYISIIICSCLIATELIGIIVTAFYAKRNTHV